MKVIARLISFSMLLTAASLAAETNLLQAGAGVFPCDASPTHGPQGGFGTQTRGGLDGRVVKVTHLRDEGKGSLRMALEALQGPRVVVFEVSGQIDLKRDIYIRHPHITIAGQTAPSPGITITRAGLRVITHDVVIEHLRFRVGNRPGGKNLEDRDAIQLLGKSDLPAGQFPEPLVYNVVVDHCSVSWSTDEGISTYFKGIRDLTIRNCLITEPLDKAGHPKGGHSMALLVGDHTQNATILGNLFAHSRYRNPVIKGGASAIVANNLLYDIGNNALHTYGGGDGLPTRVSAIANVLLAGPTRKSAKGNNSPVDFYADKTTRNNWTNPGSQIYLSGNSVPTGSVEGKRLLDYDVFVSQPPIKLDSLRLLPADKVQEYVLVHAGARPKDRDAVDTRIVQQVRSGTGRIIDTQDDVGGWPVLAENQRVLDPPAADQQDGRSKLEDWLETYRRAVQ
jgi:pectate lyase